MAAVTSCANALYQCEKVFFDISVKRYMLIHGF
jgi:hypothetical protein